MLSNTELLAAASLFHHKIVADWQLLVNYLVIDASNVTRWGGAIN